MKWTKAELRRLAAEVRKTDLKATPYQRVCPYELAGIYGVAVYSLEDLVGAGCPPEAIEYFMSVRPDAWSAALVPNGTGQFILENSAPRPAAP